MNWTRRRRVATASPFHQHLVSFRQRLAVRPRLRRLTDTGNIGTAMEWYECRHEQGQDKYNNCVTTSLIPIVMMIYNEAKAAIPGSAWMLCTRKTNTRTNSKLLSQTAHQPIASACLLPSTTDLIVQQTAVQQPPVLPWQSAR